MVYASSLKLGLGLPIPIAFKFWSILEESSHENLISECVYGLSQNQIESFNGMIQRISIPKTRNNT